MKKCPSCDKTFEDSMRFCQVDGTSLVDDAPAFDPYATMVAPAGISLTPPESEDSGAATQVAPPPPVEAISEPDDVLEMPATDPLKTMYVSEAEMREALGTPAPAEDSVIEIPPLVESEPEPSPEPEPPTFIAPEITPPPSPFAAEPSIPSPFDTPPPPPEPMTASYVEPAFEPPPFKEPEPPVASIPTPFEQSSAPPEWTPPPAPDSNWQNQQIGSNTPFQPPMASLSGGQNKTFPIVSLVLGILSVCCPLAVLTGPAALITGFLGLKNANSDPNNYGGKGLAIAGMILGGLFFLLSIVWWILRLMGLAYLRFQ